jgi:serine/threonine protein kinase
MKTESGTVIDDKFVLHERLGAGRFGAVYRARQLQFERDVALKFLNAPDIDEEIIKRFEREAKILEEFQTKYTPRIYGYGIWECRPYMAIELIEGNTLHSVLQKVDSISLERLQPIVRDVALGLQYAHNRGVVHRDLSSSNVLLVENHGKEEGRIIDFGLATFTEIDLRNRQKLTEVGYAMGSFHYMSPEQCLAEPADARSDIYSLGCIIFRALTGNYPYEAENEMLLMRKHINEPTPQLPSTFPTGLQNIIDKMLAKNPEDRYQNAQEFLDDWNNIEGAKGVAKSRAFAPSLGFIALMLLVVVIAGLFSIRPTKDDQSNKAGLANDLFHQAQDLESTVETLSVPEQQRMRQRQSVLYEKALRLNAQTHELSEIQEDEALRGLGMALRSQYHFHDAMWVLERAIDSEIVRHAVTWKTVALYQQCGAESPLPDDQRKAIAKLRPLLNSTSPYLLIVQGEARLGIAENLVKLGEYDRALKELPPADQYNKYFINAARVENLLKRIRANQRGNANAAE